MLLQKDKAAWTLSGSRCGDDGGVDDAVVTLIWWSPARPLPPVLSAQRGIVDHLTLQGRHLKLLALCRDTKLFNHFMCEQI